MDESKSKKFRKTKIIATLGPACHNVDTMSNMLTAGMNCARFNFSHGSHEEHLERLSLLRKAEQKTEVHIAIMLDTKGPEIRTGLLKNEAVTINSGDTINVSGSTKYTTKECIALSYSRIHIEVQPNMIIKIADGSIVLRVNKINRNIIECTVLDGGILESQKNVNIPEANINLPNLSSKDIDDIKFAIKHNYDFIAASFIRSPEDVLAIRKILDEDHSKIQIISKIENQEGLDNLQSIIQMSDGIMIARGDLAEQIPAEQIPLIQKTIIRSCNKAHKIVITATQMLQSMEESPTPTRAELTDVANAIFDGTDAIMLSGETAKGKFPKEAIETMDSVGLEVENSQLFHEHVRKIFFSEEQNTLFQGSSATESVVTAALIVADKSNAAAFVSPSRSGNTPKQIACLRPIQPIVATTSNATVYRQLMLLWGVFPILTEHFDTDSKLLSNAINNTKKHGFLKKNGKLIIIGGFPTNEPLMINTIRVHFEGAVVLRGRQGLGPIYRGKIYRANSPAQILAHKNELEYQNSNECFIYFIPELTYQMLPVLPDIAGIVVEHPSAIPLDTIKTQFPHLSCLSHIDDLIFHELENGKEIILSGQEKYAYEP